MVHQLNGRIHFSRILQNVTLERDELAVSFHVTSLYTSVLIKDSLDVLHSILISDRFEHGCSLDSTDIATGVDLCPIFTFFTFNHVLYRQDNCIAMGFPVSPVAANIFFYSTGSKALATFHNSPRICHSYAFIRSEHRGEFLHCFKGQGNPIKFTMEIENAKRFIGSIFSADW